MRSTLLSVFLLLLSSGAGAEIPMVDAWAYQLQNAVPAQIANNNTFDLIIMDQAHSDGPDGYYTPVEIASIKDSGKLPICYLSVGEAENYRDYWQAEWDTNPPAWLGPENPDWPGNFKVRFWDPQWQEIIFNNIRTIADQGFSGLYLDIIDGYWYWSDGNLENPQADRDMAQFVIAIGDSLRAHGGQEQLLIPQNGEYIVAEDDVEGVLAEQYYQAIDAIGIEDVFFYGALDENNPWNPDPVRLQILTEYRQRGITVLSVEYLTNAALISQYQQAATDAGFIPYTSVRALDLLTDGMAVSAAPGPVDTEPVLQVTANSLSSQGWSFNIHSDQPDQAYQLEIFDLRGRRQAQGSGVLNSGWNEVNLNTGRPSASGLYLYRLSGDFGAAMIGKIMAIF